MIRVGVIIVSVSVRIGMVIIGVISALKVRIAVHHLYINRLVGVAVVVNKNIRSLCVRVSRVRASRVRVHVCLCKRHALI